MEISKDLNTVFVGILVGSLLMPGSLLAGMILPSAEAWKEFSSGCEWANPITWRSMNLTSTHLADTKDAIVHWNDSGANLFMDQTTGTAKVPYYTVNRSDVDWNGLNTQSTCLNGVYNGVSNVYLNSFKLGSDRTKIVSVSAHETGHALGLDHTQATSNGGYATMWAANINIIGPTLDDIRGVKTKYGAVTSNSQCTEWKTNGDVTHNGTCSGSNPALDMREFITTAASNSKAVATTTSSTTSLPSNGALVMTVKVKATTVNKFIMGAFTSTDVSNTLNRVAAIEMSSDGFWLVRSTPTGYVRSQIGIATPAANTVYFLELIIRDDQITQGLVFKDDGSATVPPTAIGKATTTVQYSWSTSVYYGTGVWTTTSSQPKSDYTISEFHNRLLSYT